MKKIDQINFQGKSIPLLGRNLILTGNNGVGKTYFLTKLYEDLQQEFRDKLIHKDKNLIDTKIKKALDIFYNEFIAYSEVLEIDFKFIKKISNLLSNSQNTINHNILELNNLYKIYNDHTNMFLSDKNIYDHNDSILHDSQKKSYYFAKIEHIKRSNELLKNTLDDVTSEKRHIRLSFNSDKMNSNTIFSFFDVNRLQLPEKALKMGSYYDIKNLAYYLDILRKNIDSDVEGALERYLIEKREEMRDSEDAVSEKYYKIFEDIEKDLKLIFDDETTSLSFDDFNNRVLVLQKNENISFGFDELPSGFKSIFKIYSNLLFKSKLIKTLKSNLNGIVIIDEIDSHLHISLQKRVLPFFIKAFPNIQFIVSTHSPFVITSTNNDTVVYDISNGEFFEDDLSRYSYESVIKGLFHVNPISAEIIELIQILKNLLNETPTNFVAIRSIIKKLIPLEENDKLDKKLRNLYLQAVNLLLDHDELEDLDV
ncbi:AAA family ATPase [Acinetobacter sp. P8-3-8]|uniref:AAA family ATPase n=1 Tax=Acinetobacter sp. P8-3-8 TaxID=1029823 RepID=UPI0002487AB6|nr:AAA family ATPase [Acinetobacter sp. P8-3-8]